MKIYQKIIVALVVCAAGFAIVKWVRSPKEVNLPMGKDPVPVEVVKAKSGEILRRIRTVGTLTAIQSVVLRPEITGKVAKVYFTQGQNVKKGDPIFKIEDEMYKVKVKEAAARFEQTKGEHERSVKLLEKQFGTPQMRDKAWTERQIAQANLEEAQIALNRTVIKAPFDGVLGLTEVSVGTVVGGDTALVTLVDLDPIHVDFHVPESYLPFVKVGDMVDVTIEDFDILPVDAKIVAISPEIDEATRTITLRAEMSNSDQSYRPGEFAHVLVVAGEINDAVLIPQTAIEREGEAEYVWLVVDKRAVKTTVSTGMRDGNEVEITHGVKEKDVVITAGQFKVHDGDEVKVVNLPSAHP